MLWRKVYYNLLGIFQIAFTAPFVAHIVTSHCLGSMCLVSQAQLAFIYPDITPPSQAVVKCHSNQTTSEDNRKTIKVTVQRLVLRCVFTRQNQKVLLNGESERELCWYTYSTESLFLYSRESIQALSASLHSSTAELNKSGQ